ncbi:terminase small subunit [Mycobacterium phage Imvubu]|uniref:HicA-like toxin n=1 Tax=Mycobacterium phage Imvubu TaxID=2686233 RepID=A0A6B9L7I8_9CAUD|nr:terminase small subunit [Mycobacterium phage Imvubu]QHB37742.1 HicA-like toxin [Mycobacterium phage Imvubu]
MVPRLVYIIGQPGAGKSQLMARLTLPFQRISVPADDYVGVAHDQLVRELSPEDGAAGTIQIIGAEIGVRRPAFGGTDALPSAVIDKAVPWVALRPYPLLLAEGARLANRRFLDAALGAGYAVTLVLLDHDDAEAWRRKRAKQIGRDQNASWVKGRLTASRNLAEQFRNVPGVQLIQGAPDDVFEQVRSVISA